MRHHPCSEEFPDMCLWLSCNTAAEWDINTRRMLFHITLCYQSLDLMALVDSGCETSCIDKDWCNRLDAVKPLPKLPASLTFLIGAMVHKSCRVRFQV